MNLSRPVRLSLRIPNWQIAGGKLNIPIKFAPIMLPTPLFATQLNYLWCDPHNGREVRREEDNDWDHRQGRGTDNWPTAITAHCIKKEDCICRIFAPSNLALHLSLSLGGPLLHKDLWSSKPISRFSCFDAHFFALAPLHQLRCS